MDEETLTVWLDTALLMLGGFILMTVLMLSMINPPAKSAEIAGEQSPGNVIVEAQWGDGLDADVDLWVQAPGDKPVGYSNKSGQVLNSCATTSARPRTSPTSTMKSPTAVEFRPASMWSMSICIGASA